MPQDFIDFINEHHVLNLSCCFENQTWSASCFYSFLKDGTFVFASDKKTRHMRYIANNPHISGTITLETKSVGTIQGLQFEGEVRKASIKAKKAYLVSFPFSIALSPTLWEIRVTYAKLTNNKLGFGKKLIWRRE